MFLSTIKGAAPPHKPPERRKYKKTKEKDNPEGKLSVFVTPE